MGKINIGIIGMNFGKEFIKIYQTHPDVGTVAICQRDEKSLHAIGDALGIPETLRFTDADRILAVENIDAIHVVTPPMSHAALSVKALNAGKHAACTIPMGLSIEELQSIVDASDANGKNYMMMETAVYTREFLFVKNLVDSGQLGRIQFVRGSHIQDMGLEGWPEYWLGFPPFWNGTHAISPLITINEKPAEFVVGHGSGHLSEALAARYGSPFAVETVTIKLADSDVVAEATRSLYEVVRQYRESFDVYGTKMAFEWEQIADEKPALFEGGEDARRIDIPDTDDLLIEPLKSFTRREEILDKENVSFIQGAGHGGSHPHLVQEFIGSIVENRPPRLDARKAANITAAGICGHESSMKGGERVYLPKF
ncbi:MAG: Gfo/Idh/MocA family oxidoreductase [Clostridiales Family XIII bacterium]|jgi:predicted dehydrogenase|nr:Gfo/Idh/MocA family oxidoreductase [Clostridiales Family XIII bacterium]